jgi:hypothetical protein
MAAEKFHDARNIYRDAWRAHFFLHFSLFRGLPKQGRHESMAMLLLQLVACTQFFKATGKAVKRTVRRNFRFTIPLGP